MVVSSADQLNSDEKGEPFRWVSENHFLFAILLELTVLPGLKRLLFCQKSIFTTEKTVLKLEMRIWK